jgi:hypothetical protein
MTLGIILAWIACVILGAVVGFFVGYMIYRLGFEFLGATVAFIGSGLGGIIAFFVFLSLMDRREERGLGRG